MNLRANKLRWLLLAVVSVAVIVGGLLLWPRDEDPVDVATEPAVPSAEELRQVALAQVVGGAPKTQLLPTVVPPGMEVVAVQDAPTRPIVGGGVHVSVYARERDPKPLAGPVLVAVASVTPLDSFADSDDVTVNGHRGQTRSRGGSTTVHWDVEDDERSGFVYGRRLPPAQVKGAADATQLGQTAEIRAAGRPSDMTAIASGDPWRNDNEWLGAAFLHGSLIRYASANDDATIELSIANGDDRLRTLAFAAVDAEPGTQVRGQEAARGPLAVDDDSSATATVWAENGDVIAVTARGISSAELDAFITSLRPALPGEWDLQKEQASQQAPASAGQVLLEGDAPDGRWSWSLAERTTSFRLRHADGRVEGGDDSINANTEDGSTPPIYGALRYSHRRWSGVHRRLHQSIGGEGRGGIRRWRALRA